MVIGIKRKLSFHNHGIKIITHDGVLQNAWIVLVISIARKLNSCIYPEKRKTNKQANKNNTRKHKTKKKPYGIQLEKLKINQEL